ncbi:helix-turn-helix domain-containing protein [Candidatus Poriferisodalis sp.]|uniref:helix-turn-helix domain-containing protein n=1 Tax=Candidatus Poriferisodalis sp. TaxID=3101277 RepID=UPI003B022131
MEAAELIRLARQRQGLSQAALAERVGTSQSVISAYERGRRNPTVDTLRRLIAATGERLEIRLARKQPEIAPPANIEEHGERLVELLGLADAIGSRRRGPLRFPRFDSSSKTAPEAPRP